MGPTPLATVKTREIWATSRPVISKRRSAAGPEKMLQEYMEPMQIFTKQLAARIIHLFLLRLIPTSEYGGTEPRAWTRGSVLKEI